MSATVTPISKRKSTYKHADRIRALAAAAPPLTEQQRSSIENLLRVGIPKNENAAPSAGERQYAA